MRSLKDSFYNKLHFINSYQSTLTTFISSRVSHSSSVISTAGTIFMESFLSSCPIIISFLLMFCWMFCYILCCMSVLSFSYYNVIYSWMWCSKWHYSSIVFFSLAYRNYLSNCLDNNLCLSKFQRYTINSSNISKIISTKILVIVIFQNKADSDKYTN